MADPLVDTWLKLAAFWRKYSRDPADEQHALEHAAWLADDERRRKERSRRYRRGDDEG